LGFPFVLTGLENLLKFLLIYVFNY